MRCTKTHYPSHLFIFLINITIKYVMISKKQASQLPHVKFPYSSKYFGITMSVMKIKVAIKRPI